MTIVLTSTVFYFYPLFILHSTYLTSSLNLNILNISYFFYREKMAQAYDFALDKIGMDLHSFPIWNDYVNFLKGVEAVGSYAENQKITAVRKVCQRGVVNPMINIELLWKGEFRLSEGRWG